MYIEMTLAEAVAAGTAISVFISIIWILICAVFRRSLMGPMVSFFLMAAPILISIAAVDLLPIVNAQLVEGDAGDRGCIPIDDFEAPHDLEELLP